MPTIPPVQQLGIGPIPANVVATFHSNPPEYPTIPPVRQLGLGPVPVNPNAGIPI